MGTYIVLLFQVRSWKFVKLEEYVFFTFVNKGQKKRKQIVFHLMDILKKSREGQTSSCLLWCFESELLSE